MATACSIPCAGPAIQPCGLCIGAGGWLRCAEQAVTSMEALKSRGESISANECALIVIDIGINRLLNGVEGQVSRKR